MKHHKQKKEHVPLRNPCRGLMAVDQAPLRNEAKREYEEAVRHLEKARGQIAQYEKRDLPKFTQWLNRTFGAILTELRELTHTLDQKRSLVLEIEEEATFGNHSFSRAYEIVMQRRQHSATAAETDGPVDEQADQEAPGEPADSENPFEDQFRRLLDEMEDAFEDMFGTGGPRTRERKREAETTPDAKGHGRVKRLYRAVVRRLHPDTQSEMTAQKLEWWHQAQAAYRQGDVEQLELILSLCEIEEKGTTAHTSLSILRRITRQLKNSFNQLKRQLSKYRRDPAWNFSRRKDLDDFAANMRSFLLRDFATLKAELQEIEEQLAAWASRAARARSSLPRARRAKARSVEGQNEFFF